jgi:hypothetical protein
LQAQGEEDAVSSVRPEDGERATRSGTAAAPPARRRNGAYWLLLVPILAVLFPWIYDSRDPELIGLPFFYWYQLVWVPLSVVFTALVYRMTREDS